MIAVVKFARLKTKADCDKEINRLTRELAKVRNRMRGDNTPHVRSGLVQQENEYKKDIQKIKAHKNKLSK